MTTRTLVRAGAIPVAVLALLTIGSRSGRPQPPRDPEPPTIPLPSLPAPTVPQPVAKPEPKSVEELIAQLHQLRKQKAELERQEKAVTEQLQARLKNQADELARLGVIPPAPAAADPPPAVDGIGPLLKK